MTAYENLNFWKNVYNLSLDKSHILNLLERVGLLSYAYERAGVFSRGMMQRLNLARLLMLNPDIILMDLGLPGMNGIEATNRIKQENPEIKVIILKLFGKR